VLSGASGIRLVETLRSDYPRVRTLLMSGYSEERLGIDPALLDEFPFLPKPFSAHELSSTVRNILDRVD
jgi:DNA-binding NtrC family response regulator